ncbi:50S ribosomal protein L10 [Candidatus Hecatella orcuttiae]|uniref:50S ribosomal protein L10 n=1 Tax=Candidatus Hecatella orcuttiae TaxID=1935119 RepID=UPI002867B289|nr:50S ribosomal protein L10 [Candidatus Hecatella orcuttiae]
MSLKAVLKVKERKKAEVEALTKLLKEYKVVSLSNLHKVRAAQIQKLRKMFRGEVIFKCAKNTLLRRSLREVSKEKPGLNGLEKYLGGSTLLILTNLDPFKLSIMLDKNKVKLPAKVGDIAPSDIVIPEGSTGLPPGPIISELTELGLPTKIEGGSIWVTRDTTLVRKGEVISAQVASLLSRLGIKPIEAKLSLTAAYEDGLVHPPELLQIDLQAFKEELQKAVDSARNLAVNAGYPTPETVQILLTKAALEGRSLSIAAKVFDKETLPILLAEGSREASSLLGKLKEIDASLAS